MSGTVPKAQSSDGFGSSTFQIRPVHVFFFSIFFFGGAIFAALMLQFTANLEFASALEKVVRRIFNSMAFRQLLAIGAAILSMRYGINFGMQQMSRLSPSNTPWEQTTMYKVSEALQRVSRLL